MVTIYTKFFPFINPHAHNFLLVKYDCKTDVRKTQESLRKRWKIKAGDWSKFRDELGEVNLRYEDDVNQASRELVERVYKVAERTLGRTKGRKKCVKNIWWNDEIKKERQERKSKSRRCRKLRAELDRGADVSLEYESAWEEYRVQQKRVKHMIRRAKVNDEKKRMDELKRKGEKGGREWYQFLSGKKREEVCVEEVIVNGEKIAGKENVAKAVKVFWEDIGGMNEIHGIRERELLLGRWDMNELDREVSRSEVEQVLKKLKNGKAAGMDEIPYEMYKWGGERMVDLLVCLFRAIWTEERVPERWNESRVILLHKGGHKSKKELKNYRPIALMDTVGKIFCMLVNERLKECIEVNGVLSEEQNGFRVDRRGEDNMFVVRELMEGCKSENKRGYFAFLDIEKAYDRVDREMLGRVLSRCGVSEKIVRIISSMYVNTRAKYALGDIETEWVYSQRGVRQGCILSPLLFSLYTEELILRAKRTGLGMKVGNERLVILMYADDVIIMCESGEDLQEVLDAVSEYGRDFSVKFSADKSKVLVVNGEQEDVEREWELGDIRVKRTNEYKYLGVMLNERGSEQVMQEKLSKANQWYGRLASVARWRANKYEVLRELWKTVAVPCLMYGMNVINWSERDMQKLEVIQNKVGRVALGANGFAAVEAIRGDMGWSTFSERCMKGCMMYKVRIERMPDERWVKKVCERVSGGGKWLRTCKRVVRKCGFQNSAPGRHGVNRWQILGPNGDGQQWSEAVWKKAVKEHVSEYGRGKWRNGMQSKSTLVWYKNKEMPRHESMYEGSYASELLFKARSQSLEVNARTYRWSVDGSRECKICDIGVEESVFHLFVECSGYMNERVMLMRHVREVCGNEFMESFDEENERCMSVILGINGGAEVKVSMEVVKIFLEKVWKKRTEMSERGVNRVQLREYEHNYAQEHECS